MTTSGDRHLRPDPSGKLRGLLPSPRAVLVRASAPYAGSFAGQVLLQLLVNLLCRQFGVVDTVYLDIPPTPVDPRAFPLRVSEDADLLNRLLALGRAVAADEVRVVPIGERVHAAVTVLVGPDMQPQSDSAFTLVAHGDGWDAFCSSVERSPQTAGASLVPFGPLLAACLAAGMVFRHSYGVASRSTSNASLWTFEAGTWRDGGGPSLAAVRLPAAHLIGLGAVGAACAFSLALAPGLSGTLIGIDPQTTDPTGRNRLLSALYDETGQPKVNLAARLFERTDIQFFPNKARWPENATDPLRRSPPEVRLEEEAFRYEWVLSCVDRNIHRQHIAGFLPRHVLSGSTDGLVAQATYYAMEGPCECLACNHPIPSFSLEDTVEELRSLSPADRTARYEDWGLAPAARAAVDEYLRDPSCGQAAEAELRRLGVDGTTDWSVGFVSVGAGAMLAAYFARCALDGVAAAVGEHSERRLVFLGAQELSRSRARRKAECSICGSPSRQERYARRWGTRPNVKE